MLIVFRCLSVLPLRWLHALGFALGWIAYLGSPTYRARFQHNVAQAGIAPRAARAAIGAAGQLVAELPWIWLRPHAQKQPLIQWKGEQLVDEALARGKGVMFMTPHIGCFEAVPQAQVQRYGLQHGAMTLLYRPSRSQGMDAVLKQVRSAPGLEPAPVSTQGVRLLLKALKQGRVIGLLPDQVPASGLGVWAPFFGAPAYTMTLATRLAQQTGATVLMTWGERLPKGRGFIVHIEPLELPLDQTLEQAATALNQRLEDLIRRRPDLYLWGYARYKQPKTEPKTEGKT